MGEQDIKGQNDEVSQRVFVKALLDDVNTLEQMLEQEMFETGIRRIGAEQEMFLVDRTMGPAPVAIELLEQCNDERLTTELARFNLEANLTPYVFGGDCLRRLEREVREVVALARTAAESCDADVLLTGILPTLRKSDLGLDNMCPIPRYHVLNKAMGKLRGGDYHIVIKGLDELETTHDNVMLESCNTSFQIHFQVAPKEFARLYNVAQAVTAPVLAAAVNSPVLFGRRLWNETRVALFQRSVDARSSHHQARGLRPRVSFGDSWVRESVLEIFREDIALFRVVLGQDEYKSSRAELAEGLVPKLQALRLHNGTVYRWNRACYGWSADGTQPHLRIENRVLPAGPSIVDEVANAAFYFGLMAGITSEYEDIAKVMDFDDAKNNFFAAARHGLDAQFRWVKGETFTASALIIDRLLPLAREGLRSSQIDEEDVARYLDIIEERVRSLNTGSTWAMRSLAEMAPHTSLDQRHRRITKAMLEQQRDGQAPVHTWETARIDSDDAWREAYRLVGQIMSTQLLTVRPEDLVDLAASMMDWEKIRHVPVEDDEGRLVGIVSHRAILRLVARGQGGTEQVAVKDIMRREPISVTPQTPTVEAMKLMRDRAVGSLPVVEDGKLVGIVTEHDLIDVSTKLLERFLAED